ncbi:MAG: Predicted permease [uncultured Thiotrichaceae bacterium]|uniref:Probable membrane transporter protein n=1 Tax=uncultured Thiotrichaceae bacterium TaxID=298394 RepID=A0A6S6SB98_9GAMM|nr:MAG: Predicted permease [uncultured Thiotrichaceae bacterium]
MLEQCIIFVISLIANIFSAFSGGGAGLIQLPALIFLGLPFPIALATHKVASVALGVGATIRHLKNNQFRKHYVVLMLASGLPGVILGANIILQIPNVVATTALGVMTMALGIYSFLNADLGQTVKNHSKSRRQIAIGSIGLFLIGILNGSLTSGTGLFATLWLIIWFGLDYKLAVAYTLVFVGLFWNGAGALTLGFIGEIHWAWLPALLLGSLLGGYIGAHLSIVKGNQAIKRVYEIITILVGLKLIF